MSSLLSILGSIAPIAGTLLGGPAGALIGAGLGGIASMFGKNMAASAAEKQANQAAKAMQQITGGLQSQLGTQGIISNMTADALRQAGGMLGANGLYGSSIGQNVASSVLSDVISKIYPAQANALLNAAQLQMQPYQGQFNLYGKAASDASQGGGMDMSFIADMMPYLSGGEPWLAYLDKSPTQASYKIA